MGGRIAFQRCVEDSTSRLLQRDCAQDADCCAGRRLEGKVSELIAKESRLCTNLQRLRAELAYELERQTRAISLMEREYTDLHEQVNVALAQKKFHQLKPCSPCYEAKVDTWASVWGGRKDVRDEDMEIVDISDEMQQLKAREMQLGSEIAAAKADLVNFTTLAQNQVADAENALTLVLEDLRHVLGPEFYHALLDAKGGKETASADNMKIITGMRWDTGFDNSAEDSSYGGGENGILQSRGKARPAIDGKGA